MKVRRLIEEKTETGTKRAVVWFGSYGKNEDGSAKFVNKSNKHDNFSIQNEMIKDDLTQKLSVIQHELWYDYQYGMPLVDDNTSKALIDSFVMKTLQENKDILKITSFTSYVKEHKYYCEIYFTTSFGNMSLSL